MRKLQTALIAFVVAFSVIGAFGIPVTAQTDSNALPYNDTDISGEATDIQYSISGNSTASNVDVRVIVTGVNTTGDTNTSTELLNTTHTVGSDETVSSDYNVTEQNRNDYDKFEIDISHVNTANEGFISDVTVTVNTLSGGGGLFADSGFLSQNVMGVPMIAWVLVLGVGAFILYKEGDEDF